MGTQQDNRCVAIEIVWGFTLFIFEEKYSSKNTLLNVLPYEQGYEEAKKCSK